MRLREEPGKSFVSICRIGETDGRDPRGSSEMD
jgi:hypothetical protein